MLQYWPAACTLLFTAAGSAKVEVNDQQIQTEIVETEHKSVQVGSMTKQQGVCATVYAEYDLTKVPWVVWLSSAVMLVLLVSSNYDTLYLDFVAWNILYLF